MARRTCKKSSGDELAMSFLVLLLMLPIFGVALIGSKDPTKKTIGTVLLVVGLVIWLAMGCGG